MNGMKVTFAHAGLEGSGSACSTGLAARLHIGFGLEHSQGGGTVDRSSEFLQVLQNTSEDAELRQMNRTEGVTAPGKHGPKMDSEVHESAGGKARDEDEPNGDGPVLVDTASPQSHLASAVAQVSAMPVPMPVPKLPLTQDSGAAPQEGVDLVEPSPSMHIALTSSGGIRGGAGGLAVDPFAWRHVETLSAAEDLPESPSAYGSLGVDQAETNSNIGLTADAGNGSPEPSIFGSEQRGEVARIAEGSVADAPDGVRVVPGVHREEHSGLAPAATPRAKIGAGEGDTSIHERGVPIAPKAEESNSPMGLRLSGERAPTVGQVHAHSALLISGESRTNSLGAQGLAVQMETVGVEKGDGGPHKVLQPQHAGIWANRGSSPSGTGRNAEKPMASPAVGYGKEATHAISGRVVRRPSPLVAGETTGHEDAVMDGVEQFREASGGMPSNALHLVKAEAEGGGIPGDWNVQEGHSGLHAVGMTKTGLDHAEPGETRKAAYQNVARVRPDVISAARGGDHDNSLIAVEDTQLSDGLSRLGTLGSEGLSTIDSDKGGSADAEVGGVYDGPDGVEVSSGESTLSVKEGSSSAVGSKLEFESDGVELVGRSDADAGIRRISPGGMRTEPSQVQAGGNVHVGEVDMDQSDQAATAIDYGQGDAWGHIDSEPETSSDVQAYGQSYARLEAALERESEPENSSLQGSQDASPMRVDLNGFGDNPEKMVTGMAPTERITSDGGEFLLQEVAPRIQVDNGPMGETDSGGGAAAIDHGDGLKTAQGRKDSQPGGGSGARSDGQSYAWHEAVLERESEPAECGSRRVADVDGMSVGQGGPRVSVGEMPAGIGPTDRLAPADGKALSEEAGRSVMQQIAAHIEARRNSQSGEFRAKLVPENLGEVQIRIRVQGRACTATIRVGNSEVGHYIEKHGSDLKVLLAESGLNLADLSVSVGSRSASGDAGRQAQTQYAFAAFTGDGRRERKEYGPAEPWLHDVRPRDVIVAQEIGRAAVSTGRGYGRIDYLA